MGNSKIIFEEIEKLLLESPMHEMKCSDEEIRSTCRLFMSIFSSLDIISSKLRMKQGEPKEEDYTMAETAVDN